MLRVSRFIRPELTAQLKSMGAARPLLQYTRYSVRSRQPVRSCVGFDSGVCAVSLVKKARLSVPFLPLSTDFYFLAAMHARPRAVSGLKDVSVIAHEILYSVKRFLADDMLYAACIVCCDLGADAHFL